MSHSGKTILGFTPNAGVMNDDPNTQSTLAQTLLGQANAAYTAHPDMQAFAPFPSDLITQTQPPFHCPCSDVFQSDQALKPKRYAALHEAIKAYAPHAHWRETYKDTDIGAGFMERFGCYCIIGEDAPVTSPSLRLFMVFMPSGLYYPWHHHPADEVYMVVAGEAVFRRVGMPDEVKGAGAVCFHNGNQPHAMETYGAPVLCLVAWRDKFETPPVLTCLLYTSPSPRDA